jgi:hypothetical protein
MVKTLDFFIFLLFLYAKDANKVDEMHLNKHDMVFERKKNNLNE